MKLGVDIGGNHISMAIIDKGEILEKIDHNIEEIGIFDFIVTNTKKYMEKYKIDLLGIGYCGTVKGGVIEKSPNLRISNHNIKERLEEELNLPIVLRNDAKCAGLAEKTYGTMKNYDDCVLLTIGTGIGGAYFYKGKLLEPKINSGFEIGHMQITKKGLKCNCGKTGCFEQYASITALKREIKKALSIDGIITGIELREMIENNMAFLEPVVEEFTENLCIGMSNIINLLEPEIIVLGGSFAYYEDIFLEKIKNKLKAMNHIVPEIKMAELKNDAGLIGATIL